MVQIKPAFFALLLVVPTLAAPISYEDLEAREPNLFKSIARGVKKVATPKNIKTAARIASIFFKREDGGELTERDVDDLAGHLEELVRREPNFHSLLHKVKKVATPHNIRTVANIVRTFVRRELIEESVPHLVTRDLSGEDALEDLMAREPNFRSFLHKVKKVATPHNIRTVANIVKTFVKRDLGEEEVVELVTRSLLEASDLEDLIARSPGAHGHSHHDSQDAPSAKPHHRHHRQHHGSEPATPKPHASQPGATLSPREFEEDTEDLLARNHGDEHHPGHHGGHGAHKKKGIKPHHRHSKHHDAAALQARELEDEVSDLLARDFESHEHPHHHGAHHPHPHGRATHGAHHHHHPALVARDVSSSLDELD